MAKLNFASEYNIEVCELYTVSGLKLDMIDFVASVDIFEDINSHTITGSISFMDTNNVVANGPIIGQEKLKLKISTPQEGTAGRVTSIDFTDSPLVVHKIDAKIQVNDNLTAFNLDFTSAEFVRNNNIRLSQSFAGEPGEDIVQKILKDEELLNSKKEYFFEKSINNFKFVAPNLRPFEFIDKLSKRCLADNYDFQPTFRFYETTKGYYFRSIDNMMDVKNPKMIYQELTPNELGPGGSTDAARNMNNIISYELQSSIDTIVNSRLGMYGASMVTVDLYNKSYDKVTYNYDEDFDYQRHTDTWSKYNTKQNPVMSSAKDEYGNTLSDYSDGKVYCQFSDRDSVGGLFEPKWDGQTYDYNNIDQWLMRRRSRNIALNSSINMRMEVPGNTFLQAGDIIGVTMRNQSPTTQAEDPILSGRYLIKNLRHNFNSGQGQMRHTIYMEVVRDTVSKPLPNAGLSVEDSGKNSITVKLPLGSEDPSDIIY